MVLTLSVFLSLSVLVFPATVIQPSRMASGPGVPVYLKVLASTKRLRAAAYLRVGGLAQGAVKKGSRAPLRPTWEEHPKYSVQHPDCPLLARCIHSISSAL